MSTLSNILASDSPQNVVNDMLTDLMKQVSENPDYRQYVANQSPMFHVSIERTDSSNSDPDHVNPEPKTPNMIDWIFKNTGEKNGDQS